MESKENLENKKKIEITFNNIRIITERSLLKENISYKNFLESLDYLVNFQINMLNKENAYDESDFKEYNFQDGDEQYYTYNKKGVLLPLFYVKPSDRNGIYIVDENKNIISMENILSHKHLEHLYNVEL